MTHVAAHIRIFDPDPTDDLVAKRTAAIAEIEKKLSEGRSVDDILRSANDLAYAAEAEGSFSAEQNKVIEDAIRKSSQAFIAEERPMEMLVSTNPGCACALRSPRPSTWQSGNIA